MAIISFPYRDSEGRTGTFYTAKGAANAFIPDQVFSYITSVRRNVLSSASTLFCNSQESYGFLRAAGFTNVKYINKTVYTAAEPYIMTFSNESKIVVYSQHSSGTLGMLQINFYSAQGLLINSISYSAADNTPCAYAPTLYGGKKHYFSDMKITPPSTLVTADYTCEQLNDYEGSTTAADIAAFYDAIPGKIIENPYNDGGTAEQGGGLGDFDTQNTDVQAADVPALQTINSGFYKLYKASAASLQALSSFMWGTTDENINIIKRLFTDPISCILGLIELPITPGVGTAQNVKLGIVDSCVSMPVLSNQFVQFDAGSITLKKYWNNSLDYSPYTKVQIYLPYIGTRALNVDEVMGKTINLKYNIDCLTGACTAMIICGGSTLYNFSGNCAMQMPITAANYNNLISSAISAIGVGVAAVASGGMSAAAQIGAGLTLANNVMTAKPSIEHGGGMGGASGFLGVQTPYLIVERARQSIPENYGKYEGYPSNIYAVIGSLSGYTQVNKIVLSGIGATAAELNEIETILKGGFYI